MKKYLVIPVLGLALLGFITYGTARAYAENRSGGYPSIVQKLVERFGLNEEDVRSVFDENRTEHQQQMRADFEDRLSQFVSEGKVTEGQKQAILAKKEEMMANYKGLKDLSFENLTHEERREEMETHREEMKTWAQENDIDLSLFPLLLGGKGRCGSFGGPMFKNR